MKKEISKKSKKWVWLAVGLAVLVVAAAVLALLLGWQETPAVQGRAKLYWNVDRASFVEEDSGLSLREPGEDGLYHIRFAVDGEQVEIPVINDKRLVNYLDANDLVTLVMDADGVVVNAEPPETVATELADSYYVCGIDGSNIMLNSSVAMNGMELNIALTKDTGVYNVDPTAEVVGQPDTPELLDYELTDGAATIADTVEVQADVTAPNSSRYLAVKAEDGTYSFHRLNMRLTTVSLRTSACGIYYKAQYECDDVLAAKVNAYGVVFSVDNMPGADFMTEADDINRYTCLEPGTDFGDSTVATSGSIFNIMKTQYTEGVDVAAENAGRGTMPIYANAYIVVDGQTFVADSANKNKKVTDEGFSNGVAFSLLDVLKAIDTNWDKYVAAGQDGKVKEFYAAWSGLGMSAWADQLTNIDA